MYVTIKCPNCGYVFDYNVEPETDMSNLLMEDNPSLFIEVKCPNCGYDEIEYEICGNEMDDLLDEIDTLYGDYIRDEYSEDKVYKRLQKYLKDKKKLKLLWNKYLNNEDYENMSYEEIIKIVDLVVKTKTGYSINELLNSKDGIKELNKLEEILDI